MLDVADFAPNPAAPEFGSLGVCHVRFGKAMRGSPPRRRAVATVMPWAAEALAQYLEEVRPCFGVPSHPALWLTERGGRISPGRWMSGSPPGARPLGCRASCRCTACGIRMSRI